MHFYFNVYHMQAISGVFYVDCNTCWIKQLIITYSVNFDRLKLTKYSNLTFDKKWNNKCFKTYLLFQALDTIKVAPIWVFTDN